MSKKLCTITKDEIPALAKELLEELRARDSQSLGYQVTKLETVGHATVLGFRGELGAGKTTLTQAIARELCITEHVTSPTFILERVYKIDPLSHCLQISNFSFHHLIHIDAYRIDSESELLQLGWAELVAEPTNLIIVEWPERIASAMPVDTLYVDCKHVDELKREISW